jgi:soluble lytic murein transglycosylase-like protein
MLTTLLLSAALSAAPDYDEEIQSAISDVADVYPVPDALVRAVIAQESAFKPDALSSAGAIGLMQVMPFNARKLGLRTTKQLWNPRLNILAGVRLLAVLLKYYEGDLVSVLVAYNSGPKRKGAVVPENGETPAYVEAVLHRLQLLEQTPRAIPARGSR